MIEVIDRSLNAPPVSPDEGSFYLVGSSPTGAWSSFTAGNLAQLVNNAWWEITPREGWWYYAVNDNSDYRYESGAWVQKDTAVPTTTYSRRGRWSDKRTSGTGGYSATEGAWTTATIADEDINEITTANGATTDASLASDQVTLPAMDFVI